MTTLPDEPVTDEIIDVATLADAEGFPEAAVNAGHSEAQLPVQTSFPPFSGVNAYNVRPWLLTSTVPRPEIDRVESDACELDAAGVDELDGVDELELLPQAAATRASGRTNTAGALIEASSDRCR